MIELDLGDEMIHVVTRDNEQCYRSEMEQAYRLRHRVFVEEKGWSELASPDGLEKDQFDTELAVHMLYIEDDRVLGYERMLPTTSPHLMSELMPHLCDGPLPVGPNIWEWTRFCVERTRRNKRVELCPITIQLLIAGVEWALARECNQLVFQTNPIWLVRMIQLHFRPVTLGLMDSMSGEEVVAFSLFFDKRTLKRLRQVHGQITNQTRSCVLS
jgi:acyl-homoserine lactone synthase